MDVQAVVPACSLSREARRREGEQRTDAGRAGAPNSGGACWFQKHKVYVQDRMLETEGLIWQLLEEGGHFYVCGDASQMAGAVETALLSILKKHLVRVLPAIFHLLICKTYPHVSTLSPHVLQSLVHPLSAEETSWHLVLLKPLSFAHADVRVRRRPLVLHACTGVLTLSIGNVCFCASAREHRAFSSRCGARDWHG